MVSDQRSVSGPIGRRLGRTYRGDLDRLGDDLGIHFEVGPGGDLLLMAMPRVAEGYQSVIVVQGAATLDEVFSEAIRLVAVLLDVPPCALGERAFMIRPGSERVLEVRWLGGARRTRPVHAEQQARLDAFAEAFLTSVRCAPLARSF